MPTPNPGRSASGQRWPCGWASTSPRAAERALGAAGVAAADVETLVFVSSTVVRSPEAGTDLVDGLRLRPTVRRVPLVGMASLGGAAGVGLAADLVRAGSGPVLVVAAEMNSLTATAGDLSPEAVAILTLFSDGAAAVVVAPESDGGPRPRLEVVGYHSTLVPDSLDVMGFAMGDDGLRWHLSSRVPEVAAATVRPAVEAAVASVGWSLDDLRHVLLHPGGAKVLDAVVDALGLPADALRWSRRRLAAHGNLSSVTLLTVLEDFLGDEPTPVAASPPPWAPASATRACSSSWPADPPAGGGLRAGVRAVVPRQPSGPALGEWGRGGPGA